MTSLTKKGCDFEKETIKVSRLSRTENCENNKFLVEMSSLSYCFISNTQEQ